MVFGYDTKYVPHLHECELKITSSNWKEDCPYYKRRISYKYYKPHRKHKFICSQEDVCDECKHLRQFMLEDKNAKHILRIN
jgi:hypothetical protein